VLPSRTPRLGWLAPLLAVSLARAQPSAGPEPDINFDSWAKEFEASEATRPPLPQLRLDPVSEPDSPEFGLGQGARDAGGDSEFGTFAPEFTAQVDPGAGGGDLGLDDLGDLGDLSDDLGDDLGAEFGDVPDLAPDPLPDVDEPLMVSAGAAAGPRSETPSGPLVGLTEMARRALTASGLIKRAERGVRAARRGIEEADAGRWPRLDLVALGRESNHRNRVNKVLGPELGPDLSGPLSQIRNDAAFVAGFDVRAPLYRGGLLNAREEIARHDEEIARLRQLQAVENVLLRLTDLYLKVLMTDASVRLDEERERQLALEQGEKVSRVKEPYVRDQLALESELELARLRSQRASSEAQRDLARARLEALTGELDAGFRLETDFDVATAPGRREDAVDLARRGNLEVRVQVAKANVQKLRVREVASGEQPRVDLDYQWRHSSPNTVDRVNAAYWYATIRADFPLFDGGRTRARKRQARERSASTDLLVQETVERAAAEAAAAWEAERRARAAAGQAQRLVSLARRNARAVQDRVDTGALGAADGARAQVALLQSRLEVFRAQSEVIRHRCRIHALTGQLALDKFTPVAGALPAPGLR
jgi:outer membrane protein TolC